MKKKLLFAFFSLSAIILFVAVLFNSMTCGQEKKIANLENKIELLKAEQTPVRFKITDRKSDSFTVAIKFFDADDNVIKRIEKKYKGTELSVDFLEFPVKDRYVAFPYKMYSDEMTPDSGDILFPHYDNAGFPQIFNYKDIDNDLKNGLQILFSKIKENDINPESTYFGNMVHDLKGVKTYKEDVVYKIIVHTKGGIEVVED